MPLLCLPPADSIAEACARAHGLRVGLDSVAIAEVAQAWQQFGHHYLRRLFTDAEAAYALAAPGQTAERLAARFAAKEAVIKALKLGEAGVSFRDIGVQRHADGSPSLALTGLAAQALRQLGPVHTALSLSHDSTHACAVVVVMPACTCGPAIATAAVCLS
jgi:holo-[acyl-carrier protein] synthase